jgi:pimeloyl-ACP methyl ester carboxylesterase
MIREPARNFNVVAADGTDLRAWETKSADAQRVTVLLCPELGAVPELWPELLHSVSGVHMVSWQHRDAGTLDDHAHDALAVLSAAGVHRCTVVGWSVGSVLATALARRAPARVSGLMLLGGAPGSSVDALLGAVGVPAMVRQVLASGGAWALQLAAPLLDLAVRRVPANELSARVLQHSGFMRPGGDPTAVAAALRRFLRHDWQRYSMLALTMGTAPQLDSIGCPLTVLAGRYDMLSDLRSTTEAVAALPQAKMRILPTSHFIPLEAVDAVNDELALLLERVEAVECARQGIEPPYPWQPIRPAQ